MADGYYTSGGVIMPTLDEIKVPNFQWVSRFTADPASNVLTTEVPHGQIAGEVVMCTSTGTLPAPLIPFKIYRVTSGGIVSYLFWGGGITMNSNGQPSDVPTRQPRLVVHTPTPHGLTVGTNVWFQAGSVGNGLPYIIEQGEIFRIGPDEFTATSFQLTGTYNDPTYGYAPVGWTGPYVPPPPAEVIGMFYTLASPNALVLAENDGWDPPPENPEINLTTAGTGNHQLWVRPLDYIGPIVTTGSPTLGVYVTGEAIGARLAVYFHDDERHQYKDIDSGMGVSVGVDYWTTLSELRPKTKWRIQGASLVANKTADLYSYGYPANSEWGLGELGVLTSGGGEHYYSLCGDCTLGNGEVPHGGGAGHGGGQNQMTPDKQIQIQYKDQDITNLVRRAQRASSTIENFRIVGQGVSGGGSSWQINPE